jgi:hypothetical protein
MVCAGCAFLESCAPPAVVSAVEILLVEGAFPARVPGWTGGGETPCVKSPECLFSAEGEVSGVQRWPYAWLDLKKSQLIGRY